MKSQASIWRLSPTPPLKNLKEKAHFSIVSSEYRTYLKQSLTFLGFKFIYSLHAEMQQLLYF